MQPTSAYKSDPLLKWPGGKRAVLSSLQPLIPQGFHRYIEPFVGGGALFFALQPARALLADNNIELMNCYEQVRDHPAQVITHLSRLQNTEEDYYAIRGSSPRGRAARAARIIYLSTLSFNGIYRENLKGLFNVPYGHKYHLRPCDSERIYAASAALSRAEFLAGDFETTLLHAKPGELIYLDPPYTVAHQNNGFVKYNARIFSWHDQIRLAKTARALRDQGCYVLISNADHPSIRQLYDSFHTRVIKRPSRIAASGQHRGTITERLFYSHEEGEQPC